MDRIPTSLFYKEDRATYGGELPQLKDEALVKQSIHKIDIEPLMQKLA